MDNAYPDRIFNATRPGGFPPFSALDTKFAPARAWVKVLAASADAALKASNGRPRRRHWMTRRLR